MIATISIIYPYMDTCRYTYFLIGVVKVDYLLEAIGVIHLLRSLMSSIVLTFN